MSLSGQALKKQHKMGRNFYCGKKSRVKKLNINLFKVEFEKNLRSSSGRLKMFKKVVK